jgi:predicted nucleic acid-binding protein
VKNSTFLDTSGWANLFIKTEPYHFQALQWFTQSRKEDYFMVTSNYIVLELVALFNSPLRVSRPQIFQYIDAIQSAPYLQIIRVDQQIKSAAWELLKKRGVFTIYPEDPRFYLGFTPKLKYSNFHARPFPHTESG